MLSREYNKRIEFYQVTAGAKTEFGGVTLTDDLLFSGWSKIENANNGFKYTEIGLNQFEGLFKFSLRYRLDFDYNAKDIYILYKNEKYIIKSVVLVDAANRYVDLFCTKEYGAS
jgi:hypothetical protein